MIIQVTLQNIHITLSPLRHEMRGYKNDKTPHLRPCRLHIAGIVKRKAKGRFYQASCKKLYFLSQMPDIHALCCLATFDKI